LRNQKRGIDRRTGWAARTAYLRCGSPYLIPPYVARLVVVLSHFSFVLQTVARTFPQDRGTSVLVFWCSWQKGVLT